MRRLLTKKWFIVLIAVLLIIGTVVFGAFPGSPLNKALKPVGSVAGPFQRAVMSTGNTLSDFWAAITDGIAIRNENEELKAEIAARKSDKPADSDKVKEELGDLVFAVCNLARHLKVDAESAAELSTSKFSRRFRAVEAGAKAQGRSLKDMTLAEMDELWNEAKKHDDD